MKRLPAVILLCLGTAWVRVTLAASVDLSIPPGGPVGPSWPAVAAHPAVVRVTVPERDSLSLGSGVLVGHTEHLGLVVTNWHVVQDAAGTIMVAFPDGFRSAGRLLKTDRHWDLAALAIWRPNVAPVPLAAYMPRPGEPLTIAGYGGGQYRAATGRLVDYAAPAAHFPFELVEVSTSARQGDSGGPIFNSRGEVAGVLFGTGGGRTMGSYSGRVRQFLLTVLPDFERLEPEPAAVASQPPQDPPVAASLPGLAPVQTAMAPSAPDPVPPVFETGQGIGGRSQGLGAEREAEQGKKGKAERTIRAVPAVAASATPRSLGPRGGPQSQPSTQRPPAIERPTVAQSAATELVEIGTNKGAAEASESPVLSWADLAGTTRAEQVKTVLAGMGVIFLMLVSLRLLGEIDGSRSHKPAPKPAPRRGRAA